MTAEGLIVRKSARHFRLAARAPRLALLMTAAVLSSAGLKAILFDGVGSELPHHREPDRDLAAEALAERFTRAYLTWDAAHPEQRERQLSLFTREGLDPGAGLSVSEHGRQAVVWSGVVQDRAVSPGRRLITVAAETTGGRDHYLCIPINRDRRGFLAVSGYPALVGAPPVATNAAPRDEREVDDPQLQAITRRAITNYLRGDAANLRADLDRSAVISLPAARLRARAFEPTQWTRPGRVATEVRAEGEGAEWTFRYELDVVKRDRWYVRSIQVNPTERGLP